MFHYGQQQISNHGHKDLGQYPLAWPDEFLALKILFDPAEKFFYCLAVFLEFANNLSIKLEVVG